MIHLGCAGWSYQHWRGTFYPRNVENELTFYSNYSLLNEINTTFYRIPSESMINRWYHSTPDDFIFSAKLTREVTHVSRPSLKTDKISMFFLRMQGLEEKLQSILIQFPPRFRNTKETYTFLCQILEKCSNLFSGQLVLEIRNKSWFTPEVKDLLNDMSITLAETTTLNIPEEYQNENVPLYYIRLLGDRKLIPDEKLGEFFLDKNKERKDWAWKLVELSKRYDTIFVLINNRFSGYAINDAISLRKILTRENISTQGFEKDDKYIKRQMSLREFF
ncbi:MAG: DUF72 domain-containing protein [Candidatus Heimdallarchaeota archaeon]|nr:MAG: DUF72 domain-containing protein [Candidatus Heimdallarchaeota archaeon]